MVVTGLPACAAALAAAAGPLREDLEGRNVCLLACGSNISAQRHAELLGSDQSKSDLD